MTSHLFHVVLGVGKNISIYVPDDLAEKMERFPEVNWSEIARRGIEDYVKGRKRREQMLRTLDELHFRLEEVRRLRDDLMHRRKTIPAHIKETEEIKVITRLHSIISAESPQARLDFRISNREYGSDVILDRLLYKLEILVEGRSIMKVSGNYLEKKEVFFGKGRVGLDVKTILPVEVCHKIHEMASPKESDVMWLIDGKVFLEGPEGTLVTYFSETKEMAFSHWKKFYEPWSKRYGRENSKQ